MAELVGLGPQVIGSPNPQEALNLAPSRPLSPCASHVSKSLPSRLPPQDPILNAGFERTAQGRIPTLGYIPSEVVAGIGWRH